LSTSSASRRLHLTRSTLTLGQFKRCLGGLLLFFSAAIAALIVLYRSLPPLAKNYVLRLLFSDADVPVALIQAWVKPQGQSQHKAAMKVDSFTQ